MFEKEVTVQLLSIVKSRCLLPCITLYNVIYKVWTSTCMGTRTINKTIKDPLWVNKCVVQIQIVKRNYPPCLGFSKARPSKLKFSGPCIGVSSVAIYLVLLVQELFFSRFTWNTSLPLIECMIGR